jgi:signal peptidase I
MCLTSPRACMAIEIITVTGDSMEPTFHDGDDLLVEHTKELSPGEIGNLCGRRRRPM